MNIERKKAEKLAQVIHEARALYYEEPGLRGGFRGVKNRTFFPQPPGTDSRRPGKYPSQSQLRSTKKLSFKNNAG